MMLNYQKITKEINKKFISKVINNKNVKKQGIMEAIVNQTVADERIQRLNEIKSVKMSAISSNKRPAAKKDKEAASWIIENWDNFKALDNVDGNDISEEIYKIISSRLEDFKSKTVKDIIDDKNLKLTEKELVLVVYLNNVLRSYFGEDYSDIDCNDIAKDLKWDVKTVKGVVGSLVVKGVVGTYDTGTGYDVVNFVGQSDMSFYHFKADELPVPTKAEEKPKAEADKKPNTVNKGAKTARKVGDVHPKHPTWIWTEYTKGKFDWRTNPANKKQGQRTDLKK